MTGRLANGVVIVGILALLGMVSMPAAAQKTTAPSSAPVYGGKAPAKPLPDGGPAPRLADGHPDLAGIWFVGLLGREDATLLGTRGALDPAVMLFDPKVTPEEKPSFQPWAIEKIKEHNRNLPPRPAQGRIIDALGNKFEKLPKAERLAVIDDEMVHLSRICLPQGVPGIGAGSHGMQLVQTPGVLVQLVEQNHDYRVIPIDGRAHTKDPDPKFNGEEVGHWDGDTLVIDTIGIDERVWNNDDWTFHSDQEHVIERYTRTSRNFLIYQITVEDPKELTKPWTSAPHRFSLSVSAEPLGEWYCGTKGSDEELTALKQLREKTLAEPDDK